ncbi:MAG: hypothetical protein M0Z95_21255 [Actinomycetota bacterium]|nr:hypothetical protein [Actinomycetota bacterium]
MVLQALLDEEAQVALAADVTQAAIDGGKLSTMIDQTTEDLSGSD